MDTLSEPWKQGRMGIKSQFRLETAIPKLHNTWTNLSIVLDFHNATIVDKARNSHERLFLEAWHSQRDNDMGNEHIDLQDIYKSLV